MIGILIKVSNGQYVKTIRKYFKDSDSLMDFWNSRRKKYPSANFYIYKATLPRFSEINHKPKNLSKIKNILYCPYCEQPRRFIEMLKHKQCVVCCISENNTNVVNSNLETNHDNS